MLRLLTVLSLAIISLSYALPVEDLDAPIQRGGLKIDDDDDYPDQRGGVIWPADAVDTPYVKDPNNGPLPENSNVDSNSAAAQEEDDENYQRDGSVRPFNDADDESESVQDN